MRLGNCICPPQTGFAAQVLGGEKQLPEGEPPLAKLSRGFTIGGICGMCDESVEQRPAQLLEAERGEDGDRYWTGADATVCDLTPRGEEGERGDPRARGEPRPQLFCSRSASQTRAEQVRAEHLLNRLALASLVLIVRSTLR